MLSSTAHTLSTTVHTLDKTGPRCFQYHTWCHHTRVDLWSDQGCSHDQYDSFNEQFKTVVLASDDCWSLRADSRFVPSHWEMSLQSKDVSHWLGASLKSALSLPDDAELWNVAPILEADHAYLPDFSYQRDHGLQISTVWPGLKPMCNNAIEVWFKSVTPEDLLIKALFPWWQALSSAANGIYRSMLTGINV